MEPSNLSREDFMRVNKERYDEEFDSHGMRYNEYVGVFKPIDEKNDKRSFKITYSKSKLANKVTGKLQNIGPREEVLPPSQSDFETKLEDVDVKYNMYNDIKRIQLKENESLVSSGKLVKIVSNHDSNPDLYESVKYIHQTFRNVKNRSETTKSVYTSKKVNTPTSNKKTTNVISSRKSTPVRNIHPKTSQLPITKTTHSSRTSRRSNLT